MRSRPWILPLLVSALGLSPIGCGGPSSKATSAATEGPPLKLLHAFEARGDQPSGRFQAVALLGDRLLAGTHDGLDLFAYDPEAGFQEQERFPLRSNPVSAATVNHIRKTGPEQAWISHSDGVSRFQGGKVDLSEQSGPAKDAVVFADHVWIARSRSIELYEPVSSQIHKIETTLDTSSEASDLALVEQPLSLCPTSPTDIWVGTQFGVLRCAYPGGGQTPTWTHYYGKWDRVSGSSILPQPGNSKLPGNRIYNLRLSPDGERLAVCTDGGLAVFALADMQQWTNWVGVHRVNKADSVRGLYHEEVPGNVAMPSSDIHDMAFGDGVLYLATPKGLAVVPEAGPDAGKVTVLDVGDGLPSSHIHGLALDRDRKILFAATGYGLAALRTP